eukprot:TRINITY_DN10237_c0_g3_i1.p2 TRINITY_DN10237_c0_g3~~TRINITY_DN10237_c0_g3_i1.p2  ORF type:complete len:488 (-),score=65.60 TRINITY_DN10237_c0_g3_i1:4028-5491(-)
MLSKDRSFSLPAYENGAVDEDIQKLQIGSIKQAPIVVGDRVFLNIEDLKIAFETVLDVNEHLNGQVEQYVQEADMLRSQISKLESHCSKLAEMLREERRTYAIGTETRSLQNCHADSTVSILTSRQGSQPSQQINYQDEEDEEGDEEEVDLSFWWQGEIHKQLEALQTRGGHGGWCLNAEEMQIGKKLGKGTFGTTYRATWRGSQVAVKSVRIRKPEEAVSFLREVDALTMLRHPNIMPFIGCCLMPPDRCWIVCEYMPGGTLYQWLYGSRGLARKKRPIEDRLKKALDVARGMQCLEESLPNAYLHRDLKPTNVFIDGAGNARVGDFGLSRRMVQDIAATLTGETGTYLYMAPEVIRHEVYNSKADVFSWGVMFAELINYKLPYSDLYLTPIQVGLAVCDEKLRPTINSSHPQALHTLLECATDFDPNARPNFRQIVLHLESIIKELYSAERVTARGQEDSIAGMFGRMLKSTISVLGNEENANKQ